MCSDDLERVLDFCGDLLCLVDTLDPGISRNRGMCFNRVYCAKVREDSKAKDRR